MDWKSASLWKVREMGGVLFVDVSVELSASIEMARRSLSDGSDIVGVIGSTVRFGFEDMRRLSTREAQTAGEDFIYV